MMCKVKKLHCGVNNIILLLALLLSSIMLISSCTNVSELSSPSSKDEFDSISEEGIVVTNDRLKVEISQPGKEYNANRFDWGAIIKQVTLDDSHTFLSTEDSSYDYKPELGYGIIGQFEPAFPRQGDGEYTVTSDSGNNEVTFTKDVPKDEKGRGHNIIKSIVVDGTKLIIKSTITNNGDKPINIGEYNHNFAIINKQVVNSDYELNFSFRPTIKKSPVIGEDLFVLNDDTLTWTKELAPADEFLCHLEGFENAKGDYHWKLTHKPTGVFIKVFVDFDISKVQIWGKSHTICPEFFFTEKVGPGESFSWIRTYEFGVDE